MGDYAPLSGGDDREEPPREPQRSRLSSVDVFRGLSISLMIFVDYVGSFLPVVAHSPWNGLTLADVVMPFFLFIAGFCLPLVYKRIPNKWQASYKVVQKTAKLFLLGILLQGGYFHGVNSLSFGIDIEKIRWLGILQRIAIGYMISALCEICSSNATSRNLKYPLLQKYYLLWFVALSLFCIYSALLHGLYVPDWQYQVLKPVSSTIQINEELVTFKVECSVRGDLNPGCNAAGMIDRYVLGINHLYSKPNYINLKECRSDNSSPWCQSPFEPEGVLSSLMAAVACLLGLHYGHVLVHVENHKDRFHHWLFFSLALSALGLLLCLKGIPLNKSLYSASYTFLTTGIAGITFAVLYFVVDIFQCKKVFFALEWMGRHSLCIFVLVSSNMAVIAIQGFYWRKPENNIVHWVIGFTQK